MTVETDIWRQKFDSQQLVQLLEDLSLEHGYSNLSSPSQKLLAMDLEERENFLKTPGHVQIKKQVFKWQILDLAELESLTQFFKCESDNPKMTSIPIPQVQLFLFFEQITITNMIKLPKMMEGEKVVECLIVTTESSHLFVLDPESFSIVEQRKVITMKIKPRTSWGSIFILFVFTFSYSRFRA